MIKHKRLSYNKDYSKKLDEKSKEKFKHTFKVSNNDINKFILLLRKGLYLYEYGWLGKVNETTLPEKEEFYRSLNMGEIIDVDYMHGKKVWKNFEKKKIGEYHDFYLKGGTLILADVFENFRKMWLNIYQFWQNLFQFLN